MTVKAVNHTAGPDGIVPILLIFGKFPRMVKSNMLAPNITVGAKVFNETMIEVSKLWAYTQAQSTLPTQNEPVTPEIAIGDQIIDWRTHDRTREGLFKSIATW